MRQLSFAILATLTMGALGSAYAADLDYDFLRGPEYDPVRVSTIDWSGVYVGGHGGYSSAALGFKNAFQPLVYRKTHDTTAETIFNASTLMAPVSKRVGDTSFGAFAGYNFQFDDVVIGIEADYTSLGLSGFTSDSIGRTKTRDDGIIETVSLSGRSATKINDFGTVRARAGYALGNFLPFVTGGFAIGRARISDGVTVQDSGFNATTFAANQLLTSGKPAYVYNFGYQSFDPADPAAGVPYTTSLTQSKTKTVGGVALGGGLEYAITPSILLRAEYQYVLFNDFDGHKANLNTVRGGAAVKF